MAARSLSLFAFLLAAPQLMGQAPSIKSPTPGNTTGVLQAELVAKGLVNPWALAFLPDGRMAGCW